MDWVAIASISTAVATLVLAIATFLSVRSGNRTARAAEQSLAAQLWPLLATAKPSDPEQKVLFQDDVKLMVPGGQGGALATPENVYLAIAIRNVGPGLAVLDRWWFGQGRRMGDQGHADERDFHRLTRDLFIPPGELGFWQGALREPEHPDFVAATAAIDRRQPITIELLYADHLGHQRTISRFVLLPYGDDRWYAVLSRHWNLDGPNPRDVLEPGNGQTSASGP